MKTPAGRTAKSTTRGRDTIRIEVRGRDGTRTTFEIFGKVTDIEALKAALKAARDKIARRRAKKKTSR